jgi:hypothetical protein
LRRGGLTRGQQESIRFGLLLYRSETHASLSNLPRRDLNFREREARIQFEPDEPLGVAL